jgi:two-component system OmpR family sensor kinase
VGWGTVLKRFEKESFLKSFSIFFLSLAMLSGAIAYLYYNEQKHSLEDEILAKMKIYNYTFKNADFSMDIIPAEGAPELATLVITPQELYALFPMPASQGYLLKILYPYGKYQAKLGSVTFRIAGIYAAVLLVLLLFSIGYAIYALKPMRNALHLLEEFLKDIIHDLNTPVTAILLNTRLLEKKYHDVALHRIALSAKTIGTLYKNLETTIHQLPSAKEPVALGRLVKERIAFFKELYPELTFSIDLSKNEVESSEDALSRILDNLLSNACKYNKPKGSVHVVWDGSMLTIEDTGVGIARPDRVFERFFKESDRGLGIGMHIVKKLCDQLGIGIKIESRLGVGTKVMLTFET